MNNYIFVHGINTFEPGYAQKFADRAWADGDVVYEIYWTLMNEIIEQWEDLQYPKGRKGAWKKLQKSVVPLVVQIVNYVREKARDDELNTLRLFDEQFQKAYKPMADKNILVTHSLGSVIAFDYLFRFKKYAIRKDQKVDLLVTMGSPIPVFTASMGYPLNDKLTHPVNLGRWVNILDPDDGVAQFMKPHFEKVEVQDIMVQLGIFPLKTHGKYWGSKKVYKLIKQEAAK